jgi:hypothetical protein
MFKNKKQEPISGLQGRMLTFKNTKQELVSGLRGRTLTFKNMKLEPCPGDKTSASETSRRWERNVHRAFILVWF